MIDQYTLEGIVNAGAAFPGAGDVSGAIGGIGRYGNRPTITYQPLFGERFTRSLLTPVPPASVFSMVQAGWPIDGVFQISVRALNGVRGPSSRDAGATADPRWAELIAAFRRLQAGAFDVRVQRDKTSETVLLVIRGEVTEALAADGRFIRETLGIEPDTEEPRLVFGSLPRDKHELAMLTRSMLDVFAELAATIEVPPQHEADGHCPDSFRRRARGARHSYP